MVRVDPGTPVTGLWCDRCAFPSGVEVPLTALTPHGVVSLGSALLCTNHDDEGTD